MPLTNMRARSFLVRISISRGLQRLLQLHHRRWLDLHRADFVFGNFRLRIECVDGQHIRGGFGKVERNEDDAARR